MKAPSLQSLEARLHEPLAVHERVRLLNEISEYLYMLEMGQVRREGPRRDFADQLRDLIRDALLGV